MYNIQHNLYVHSINALWPSGKAMVLDTIHRRFESCQSNSLCEALVQTSGCVLSSHILAYRQYEY